MADEHNEDVRLFSVETRFQKMARQPGGVPRDQALRQAFAAVEEMKGGFDAWLDGEMQALVDAVARAQAGTPAADWAETANVHSRNIRDVGTTMGSELLSFVANSLCEVLDAIEAGVNCNLESITCHLDALILARQPEYRGLSPEQLPELAAGLRSVADRVSIGRGDGPPA
jgi:hypothetical protein